MSTFTTIVKADNQDAAIHQAIERARGYLGIGCIEPLTSVDYRIAVILLPHDHWQCIACEHEKHEGERCTKALIDPKTHEAYTCICGLESN